MLIELCLLRRIRAVCVREVQISLEQSVKALLELKIKALGVSRYFRSKNNCIETPYGGLIIFKGMQEYNASNIKSLEDYDIAWAEEAQTLSALSWRYLRATIRNAGSELWASWNPDEETDPVDAFFRSKDRLGSEHLIAVELNYYDNPFLPNELRIELEHDKKDLDTFANVWLGGYRKLSQSRVFRRWRTEKNAQPLSTRFLLGADWGLAADPTVLVRCTAEGRKLVIDRAVGGAGIEIEDTPALFAGLDPEHAGWARRYYITADSSRPETISHLKRNGYPLIIPAKKGAGSVEEGVKFLQGYEIIIDESLTEVANEFKLYSYKVDRRTGLVLPELVDEHNHYIDALRYAVERLRGRKAGAI